jgi:membrane associated rhomboid family serine protease
LINHGKYAQHVTVRLPPAGRASGKDDGRRGGALRTAQGKFGHRPLNGEEARWGFEHLDIDAARLKASGFEGLLPPFSLNEAFCLPEDLPRQPQYFYTLLTYGFLHDSSSPWHLIFNMVTLWFFGREIEAVLGRAEFIRFYCASIIFAGLGWVVVERFSHPTMAAGAPLIGASGGVMAVLAAFIWYYPRQTLLVYGVLPVPAWALGLLYLASDIGGLGDNTSKVAHVAHLGGALFGILYAWRGWSLEGLGSGPIAVISQWFSRRPRMQNRKP